MRREAVPFFVLFAVLLFCVPHHSNVECRKARLARVLSLNHRIFLSFGFRNARLLSADFFLHSHVFSLGRLPWI